MLEAHILKLNVASLIHIVQSIVFLLDDRLLLEHEEKVLNIDLRLINLSEKGAHVEEWPCKLHKKSLNHDEITRGEASCRNIPGRKNKIDGETSRKDEGLTNVQVSQRLLNSQCRILKLG